MKETPKSPLRIGFDAKRANANRTGLGNYSRFVIDALAAFHPALPLRLYIPKPRSNDAYQALLSYPQVSEALPQSRIWRLLSSLWRTFGMAPQLQHDKIGIFHGLSNELPTGLRSHGIRSIVTIHDLIFLRYPQFYKPLDRMIYTWKFRAACRTADRIVAVSECTKRDIVQFFHTDPARIEVIYQGCSPEFGAPVDEQMLRHVRQTYALPRRFLLNVGSIESRKNLMLAAKALHHLPEEMHLVAIGRHTPYADEVRRYAETTGIAHRVHLHHSIPFRELTAIYRLAETFVYPSFFEGFGIPIIEAISAGLPVIGTTGSCLEEAGGSDCIYVAPDDDKALAEAVERIAADKELRERMVSRSREYIKRFDKEVIASQMADLYERVAAMR